MTERVAIAALGAVQSPGDVPAVSARIGEAGHAAEGVVVEVPVGATGQMSADPVAVMVPAVAGLETERVDDRGKGAMRTPPEPHGAPRVVGDTQHPPGGRQDPLRPLAVSGDVGQWSTGVIPLPPLDVPDGRYGLTQIAGWMVGVGGDASFAVCLLHHLSVGIELVALTDATTVDESNNASVDDLVGLLIAEGTGHHRRNHVVAPGRSSGSRRRPRRPW